MTTQPAPTPPQTHDGLQAVESSIEISRFSFHKSLKSLIDDFRGPSQSSKTKEILAHIDGCPVFGPKLSDDLFATNELKEQIRMAKDFHPDDKSAGLDLPLQVILLVHEKTILLKWVSFLLHSRKVTVDILQIHPRFSLVVYRHLGSEPAPETLTLHTPSSATPLPFAQWWGSIKATTFVYSDILKTPFERCSFSVLATLEAKEVFQFYLYDREAGGKKHSMVYILSNLMNHKAKAATFEKFTTESVCSRVIFLESKSRANYSIQGVFQRTSQLLKLFNPPDYDQKFEVVANPKDVGVSNVVFETAELMVEELVVSPEVTKRRLLFKNSEHYIQSEVVVVNGKPDFSRVDFDVYDSFGKWLEEAGKKAGRPLRVCILGGGCGVLMQYLRLGCRKEQFTSVEISADVAKVAKEWFFFEEGEGCRLVVQDALDFLSSGKAKDMDVVLVDIDSKEENSPPFYFLEKSVVKSMVEPVRANAPGVGFVGFNIDWADKAEIKKKLEAHFGEGKVKTEEFEGVKNYAMFLV